MKKQKVHTSKKMTSTIKHLELEGVWAGYVVAKADGLTVCRKQDDNGPWSYNLPIFVQKARWGIK